MKKLNKNLYSSGFSLISVMVAIGLTAGLATAIMVMIDNSQKQKGSLEASYEVMNIHNEMIDLLKNFDNCTQSFKNLNPKNTAGSTISNLKFKRTDGSFVNKYQVGQLVNGKIKIVSYRLSDAASSEVNVDLEKTTHLIVDYKKDQNKVMTKKIKINLNLQAGGTILSCRALEALANTPVPGPTTPGGKCISKSFEFHNDLGWSNSPVNPDSPYSPSGTEGGGGIWRKLTIYCPSRFPVAVSSSMNNPCWSKESNTRIQYPTGSYANSVICTSQFLRDWVWPDNVQLEAKKDECATLHSIAKTELTASHLMGQCFITCCDL
jgi:hypothetical protein